MSSYLFMKNGLCKAYRVNLTHLNCRYTKPAWKPDGHRQTILPQAEQKKD